MSTIHHTNVRKCLPLPPPEPFDYCAIAPEHVADLRQRAARIREQVRVTTVSAIEIGNELLSAKQHLPHGQFEDWVRAECGCAVRTARNYMAAAAFAEGKSATVADLPPSIVYKLAAKSTPPELAAEVIERAAAGKVVDPAGVKAVLQFAAHERRQCEAAHERNTRRSAAARPQREARERERVAHSSRRRKLRTSSSNRSSSGWASITCGSSSTPWPRTSPGPSYLS